MASGCFVRCLWGEDSYPVRKGVLHNLKHAMKAQFQPTPTLWFCYGRNNADVLWNLGIEAMMLDEQPISNFGLTGDKNAQRYGTVNWGQNFWRHKYPPLRHALAVHEAAVWLDLDTNLTQPLPDDFWDRMAQGRELQSSLRQFHQRRAHWRGKADIRKIPCGSFIYVRGQSVIDRIEYFYDQMRLHWDPDVLARTLDDLWGGWKGAEAYKRDGWEPYCHTHELPRAQIHKPEIGLFASGRKIGLMSLQRRGVISHEKKS